MLEQLVGNLATEYSQRKTLARLIESVEANAPPEIATFMLLEAHTTPPPLTATVGTVITEGSAAPPNVTRRGDRLTIRMPFVVEGTAGSKFVNFDWCGEQVFQAGAIDAASVGDFLLEIVAECVSDNGQDWQIDARVSGPSTVTYQIASKNAVNPATTAISYQLLGLMSVAGPSLTPSYVEVVPRAAPR